MQNLTMGPLTVRRRDMSSHELQNFLFLLSAALLVELLELRKSGETLDLEAKVFTGDGVQGLGWYLARIGCDVHCLHH